MKKWMCKLIKFNLITIDFFSLYICIIDSRCIFIFTTIFRQSYFHYHTPRIYNFRPFRDIYIFFKLLFLSLFTTAILIELIGTYVHVSLILNILLSSALFVFLSQKKNSYFECDRTKICWKYCLFPRKHNSHNKLNKLNYIILIWQIDILQSAAFKIHNLCYLNYKTLWKN